MAVLREDLAGVGPGLPRMVCCCGFAGLRKGLYWHLVRPNAHSPAFSPSLLECTVCASSAQPRLPLLQHLLAVAELRAL